MTIDKPLILMALANDSKGSLQLRKEEKKVRNQLSVAHDSERIEFRSLGNTTLEDLYKEINRARKKIAIFHFSGHSNSKGLALENTLAKKESLGTLLGKLPNLKLVFLNGCANKEQVQILQNSGVRAIIATSAQIEDNRALTFAELFYQSMVGGDTIQTAFDTARSFLQNDDSDLIIKAIRVKKINRNHILPFDTMTEGFPWGLYYQDDNDVSWRMPLPEQLDETLKKTVTTLDGHDFQLSETLPKSTTVFGDETMINAVELETTDRRVQNLKGILKIQSGEVSFGRHPACQVIILEKGVSRHHAKISRQGNQIILSDEDSTNGTFWNDTRISQIPLTEDGKLRIDDVEFKVRVIK